MKTKPKVSIVCVTYNQQAYIEEALDSFLMQKTDFEYEIIIADDSSTDRTPQIIKKYASDYPGIIKPILAIKNIGVAGNFLRALRAATGKYIALCEGDDYWTDPQKLQLQANLLDKKRQLGLCFHTVKVISENPKEKPYVYPKNINQSDLTTLGLLKKNYVQTNSVMYRKQNYKQIPTNILPVDWYLHLYHAKFGDIGFIDKTMSVYRRHAGGVWWESSHNIDAIWEKHGLAHLSLYIEFLKLYGHSSEYKTVIYNHIDNIINNFVRLDIEGKKPVLGQAIVAFPTSVENFIQKQYKQLKLSTESLDASQQEIAVLKRTLEDKEEVINTRNQEITDLKASPFWKLRNLVVRILGKPAV